MRPARTKDLRIAPRETCFISQRCKRQPATRPRAIRFAGLNKAVPVMSIEKVSRLGALALAVSVGIIVLMVAFGVNHIRNGGALDNREQMLSDFRADILPPPRFLVESFANTSIMTIHREAYGINVERLTKLEQEYWASQSRWA